MFFDNNYNNGSDATIELARDKYDEGDFEFAIDLLKELNKSSPEINKMLFDSYYELAKGRHAEGQMKQQAEKYSEADGCYGEALNFAETAGEYEFEIKGNNERSTKLYNKIQMSKDDLKRLNNR